MLERFRWMAAVVVIGAVATSSSGQGTGEPAPAQPAPTPTPRSPLLRPSTGAGQTNPPLKPKPTATLFDPQTNVKEAIDAAIKRAGPDWRRVLVFWGFNESRWALKLQEQLQIPDTDRMIRFYYEPVFADVGEGNFGALNRALAQTYGANITIEKHMLPYVTVIETVGPNAGKTVISRSTHGMEKPRSTKENGDYYSLNIQDFLSTNRAIPPSSTETVNGALSRAREGSVPAMLFFMDQEDPWCHRFDTWLHRSDVREVLDRHFAPASVDLIRQPDAPKEFERFGGTSGEASPWYVFVDAEGKRLAPDKTRGERDFGYPTGDEVKPFLAMLRRLAPKLSDDESEVLRKALVEVISPPSAKKD